MMLAMAGCQNVGEDQTVKIISEPTGAVVRISGVEAGITPLSVALPTHFETQLSIERSGFKTEVVTVAAKGKGVLRPNPVKVRLVPAFMPDDPAKANYETAQQTLKWMKDSGQYDKKDIAYIETYLKRYFRK